MTMPMPPRRCSTTCERVPGATTSSVTPASTRRACRRSARRPRCSGTLRAEVADALGLSRHCRVIVGTGDDHAGALGAGALAPGVIVDVTGTAEPVAVPSREAVLDDERMIETHAHAVDEMLLVENPGFVSGGSTRWWAATQGIPQAELFGLAALAPPGLRRRALPPHALRLDRAALERPHARVLRGARAEPRRRAPGARRARGLRVRAARHRRPLRGARAGGRRDPRRRRRRALGAVAADQGRRHEPPGASRARRVRDEHRRGDAGGRRRRRVRATSARPRRPRSSWPPSRSSRAPSTAASTTTATARTGACSTASKERWHERSRRRPPRPTSRATSPRCACASRPARRRPRCARSGSAACCSAPGVLEGIADVVAEVRRRDGDVALVADRRADGRARPARSRRSSPPRWTPPG